MIDLEHVLTGDGVERNFDKLRSLVPDLGGQSVGIRFGADTLAWPAVAAASSNAKTITHGLGVVPVAVFVAAYFPVANTVTRGVDIEADDAGFTTTTFGCRGKFSNGLTSTATLNICWVAFG